MIKVFLNVPQLRLHFELLSHILIFFVTFATSVVLRPDLSKKVFSGLTMFEILGIVTQFALFQKTAHSSASGCVTAGNSSIVVSVLSLG